METGIDQKRGGVFLKLTFWLKTFIHFIEITCERNKTILEDIIYQKNWFPW